MLDLPDVTLFCIYTVAHELTLRALGDCLRHVRFGGVALFTDRPPDKVELGPNHWPRVVRIKPGTSSATYYNDLMRHVHTNQFIGFQWDAWVINPAAWTDEFLEYDYIGAPWWYRDGLNVGNGGFCLQSRRLQAYLARHRDEFPVPASTPEDDTLCRLYRPRLERAGFRWAPEELAYQFSQERTHRPFTRSFGFHGIFNWPYVLTGDALRERMSEARADDYVTSRPEWRETGDEGGIGART